LNLVKYTYHSFFLLVVASFLLLAGSLHAQNFTRTRSFNADWRFTRDSVTPGAEQPGFDDSKWRRLDIPHDWSIEDLPQQVEGKTIGPFSKESPGAAATGYTIGGTGWYRKTFILNEADKGKLISVYFEGVYMEADVWVNGNHLGKHPHGYTSFYYDITKYCKPAGLPNVIAVRVINKGKNSRWYSGSGIYRNVWLTVTSPLHIGQWGVYITTPEVSAKTATVKVQTTVLNEGRKKENMIIRTRLLDAKNKPIAHSELTVSVGVKGRAEVFQNMEVSEPEIWSPELPNLYRAEVSVLAGGAVKDFTSTPFGIRSIRFSAENGFLLNGVSVKLRGGCVHHDNGLLGAAAIDRAEERKIELLKSNGFNAIRCSHNPPSEKFLETCDRLGMLVVDECFDQWEKPKNPDDYHRFFDKWGESDFSAMIRRDHNHPAVILWSLGNEIEERADPAGLEITKKLKAAAGKLDPSRPVTEAVNEFWDHPGRPWAATAPAFELLDVGGYNYMWWEYENDHKLFPHRVMMGTESVPQHVFQNWQLVEKHLYIIGDFVWTAMDYLGESGIGHTTCDNGKDAQLKPWPWFNAYCGDIDLTGNKKPQSHFRDIVWKRSKIAMAVHTPIPAGCKESVSYWGWPDEQPSWTWPGNEGRIMEVTVYTRYHRVRLELNGKRIGEKNVSDSTKLSATFELPYEPGELRATGIDEGKDAADIVLATTGSAKSIRLKADRAVIHANRNDLAYITVEVVDEKGNTVPNAAVPVQFSISGNGELAGVGNANPADMAGFKQLRRSLFRGRCLVILRPKGAGGDIVLEAKAEGLEPAKITVHTK
jgi:beta-galactosidase